MVITGGVASTPTTTAHPLSSRGRVRGRGQEFGCEREKGDDEGSAGAWQPSAHLCSRSIQLASDDGGLDCQAEWTLVGNR